MALSLTRMPLESHLIEKTDKWSFHLWRRLLKKSPNPSSASPTTRHLSGRVPSTSRRPGGSCDSEKDRENIYDEPDEIFFRQHKYLQRETLADMGYTSCAHPVRIEEPIISDLRYIHSIPYSISYRSDISCARCLAQLKFGNWVGGSVEARIRWEA